MSKYTTELRYICETYAGYSESQGYDKVNDIIEAARPHIFENYDFFDDEYKPVIETKILRHYYTREIGLETVGLWKLHFNNKLQEILPYYNKLYASAALEFNPLSDVDYTISHEGNGTNTGNRSGNTQEQNGNTKTLNTTEGTTGNYSDNTGTTTGTKTVEKYSDTPQGGLTGIETGQYLTSARITEVSGNAASNVVNSSGTDAKIVTDSGTIRDEGTRAEIRTENSSATSTEAYIRRIEGKIGATSYSKMLLEYRKTLINIDQQLIDEFKDLFFLLW